MDNKTSDKKGGRGEKEGTDHTPSNFLLPANRPNHSSTRGGGEGGRGERGSNAWARKGKRREGKLSRGIIRVLSTGAGPAIHF